MNYLNIALKIFIINEYAKSDEFFNRRLQDLADGVGLYQEAVMAVDSRNLEIAGTGDHCGQGFHVLRREKLV